jgi:hypothetical protein
LIRSKAIYVMNSDGADLTLVRTFADAAIRDLDW